VIATAGVIIIGVIAIIGVIFYCFHKTKPEHVKLKAGWGSVELEIDRPERPPPQRQLESPDELHRQ
jgi:FtsZ-interacting cell division protein ZipA